jgi:hypothetical protein
VTGHKKADKVAIQDYYQAYHVDKKTAKNDGNGILKETPADTSQNNAINVTPETYQEAMHDKIGSRTEDIV